MRVEGPCNYMVAALGSCVRWPLDGGARGEEVQQDGAIFTGQEVYIGLKAF